ncbi:MAG: amino acid permease [Chlamydiae bacterium]|nr:amino acid permease [Chlamydiota bacterium]
MADIEFKSKKALGFFQLVMINVIAVDSIRTLPFSAAYGFSLVFFYILAALLFFIPTALVAAELGTGWPTTGGVYVWVREAFGKKWSLVVIWLNWIYNVVWYPTIIALIAGTAAYFFDPALSDNKLYMGGSVVVLFWLATWLNLYGMKISGIISAIGAIIGTILPMVLISALGFVWWKGGNPLAISVTADSFFPSMTNGNNLAFLTNVLFGLMGLEMAATHAADMKNPQRDYPKSLLVSVLIILATIVFASLAIALVVPANQLNLATGAMQAFSLFLHSLNMGWAIPLVAGFIILGGISGMGAWIIGPTKGLMVASQDGSLPKILQKKNKHGVPVNILLIQGVIVTLLSLAFIIFPTVNSSFWILSAVAAQLALLVYVFLFLAAIKLHHSRPEVKRSFKVPGKKWGMWICSGAGLLSSIGVIGLGFIPPSQIDLGNIFSYEMWLIGGMILLCSVPFFIFKWKKRAS